MMVLEMSSATAAQDKAVPSRGAPACGWPHVGQAQPLPSWNRVGVAPGEAFEIPTTYLRRALGGLYILQQRSSRVQNVGGVLFFGSLEGSGLHC